MGGGEDE
jgi:hypothetical protein